MLQRYVGSTGTPGYPTAPRHHHPRSDRKGGGLQSGGGGSAGPASEGGGGRAGVAKESDGRGAPKALRHGDLEGPRGRNPGQEVSDRLGAEGASVRLCTGFEERSCLPTALSKPLSPDFPNSIRQRPYRSIGLTHHNYYVSSPALVMMVR